MYDSPVSRALRVGFAVAIAIAWVGDAHADGAHPAPAPAAAESVTVALLPLATDKGLALYGQPIASELARALRGGGLDVVVVSAGAPVPSRAVLVIDGTVAADGGGIALELRVRDPARGAVVATLAARAPELAAIDRAAAELAAKLLPAVRAQLRATVAAPPHDPAPPHGDPVPRDPPSGDPPPPRPVAPARPVARVAIHVHAAGFPDEAATALATGLVARVGHRAVVGELPRGPLADADLGLELDVVGFELEQLGVLTARARVRLRWRDARGAVIADRVIRTDTVVGSRKDDAAAVARACAAQLLEIAAPRARAWAGIAR